MLLSVSCSSNIITSSWLGVSQAIYRDKKKDTEQGGNGYKLFWWSSFNNNKHT